MDFSMIQMLACTMVLHSCILFAHADCSGTEYECDGGTCIPEETRCDGNSDCPYNSDELLCASCSAINGTALLIYNGDMMTRSGGIITQSNTSDTDPCRFRVIVVPSQQTQELDWIIMDFGVHDSGDESLYEHTIMLRAQSEILKVSGGEWLTKPYLIRNVPVPHSWTSVSGLLDMNVTYTPEHGWILNSTTCSFSMQYTGATTDPLFHVSIGYHFLGQMIEQCGEGQHYRVLKLGNRKSADCVGDLCHYEGVNETSPDCIGDLCEKITKTAGTDCSATSCANGGVCVTVTDTVQYCDCGAGFEGEYCETNIDECMEFSCENGATCVDEIDSFHCECAVGFEGENCDTNIDECIGVRCVNGGACRDMIGGYLCVCPIGFAGVACETYEGL